MLRLGIISAAIPGELYYLCKRLPPSGLFLQHPLSPSCQKAVPTSAHLDFEHPSAYEWSCAEMLSAFFVDHSLESRLAFFASRQGS
jgi:hypothetical protein